jgi:hypothetical protein
VELNLMWKIFKIILEALVISAIIWTAFDISHSLILDKPLDTLDQITIIILVWLIAFMVVISAWEKFEKL